MQAQTQNIQRPALFSDFFGLELMWNNEYLSYIHTVVKNVTSIHNLTINHKNIIKNSLNTFTQSNLMFIKSLRKIDTQSRNCIQSLT